MVRKNLQIQMSKGLPSSSIFILHRNICHPTFILYNKIKTENKQLTYIVINKTGLVHQFKPVLDIQNRTELN